MTALPLPKPGPRKPLSRAQTIELCIRQGLKCGCGCGKPLTPKCVDEHVTPRETLPADVADHIDNRALYLPDCAKLKTVADQAVIAHWRRVRGDSGQRKRREARGGSSIKGRGFQPGAGAKLQSRGFPSKFERERLKAIREKTPIEEAADA